MNLFLKKILFFFSICFFFKECKIYSFVGSNLNSNINTFSVLCISKTSKGPLNIENELKNTVSKEISNRTTLKETQQNGDLKFTIMIIDYSVDPDNRIGPSSNLSITVELNFQNEYDSQSNISKKIIRKTSYMQEEDSVYSNQLMKETFEKITEEILQLTILNW